MDKQYSWKKTEDIEADLADMLYRLCRKWKQIAVCALAAAVILGGYGWMKEKEDAALAESVTEEGNVLSELEEQGVADAVRLRNEIRELETYLDNSILMQLDPYHKAKHIMLYCIDQAKRQELPQITESYLNFVQNGGAADALAESGSWEMDKSYLAEVLSAYQKVYSAPYQVVIEAPQEGGMQSDSLFYVEITGKNARQAEKMAQDLQDVVEKYSVDVKTTAGSHRLKLVSSMESITADASLQSQQHDRKALLSSDKASLKAATDAFSEPQLAAYNKALGVEDEINSRLSMKYMILGIVGGIFVYCCVFSCWYIFSDTVKSLEEMKRLYTFPVYGGILLEDRQKKSRAVSGAQKDAYGHTQEQVLKRIRFACQKQGTARLCAAADFALDAMERECLENMAEQLKDWEIELTVIEGVSSASAVWDSLIETGNVLMVCRIGTTTHQMISGAMDFYQENNVAVAGAAVFFKNDQNRI